MSPIVDIVFGLISKAIDVAGRLIEAQAQHTAEERAAMMADLKQRVNAEVDRVQAVKFRDVDPPTPG